MSDEKGPSMTAKQRRERLERLQREPRDDT